MIRYGNPVAVFLALMVVAAPSLAVLKPGDSAPLFTTRAVRDGDVFTFSLKQALDDGPVVLYFFPSAFTHGCDLEAHTFATHKAKFARAGASILGVSADSMKRLKAFSRNPEFCAGQFPVAPDPEGQIARQYAVPMTPPREGVTGVRGRAIHHGFFQRVTYVIGQNGEIVATLSSRRDDLTPVEHVLKSLAIVRKLQDSQHKGSP